MHSKHRVTKSLKGAHAHKGSLARANLAEVENLHLEGTNCPLSCETTCPRHEHKRSSNRSLEWSPRAFAHASSRIFGYSSVRSSIRDIASARALGLGESSRRKPVFLSSTISGIANLRVEITGHPKYPASTKSNGQMSELVALTIARAPERIFRNR